MSNGKNKKKLYIRDMKYLHNKENEKNRKKGIKGRRENFKMS